jgi:hemoglobin-like flavoprotein
MSVQRHPVATSSSFDSLAIVPLDRALVARLRGSYEAVRLHELRLAEIFYAKLFAAAPQVRSLFKSDTASQAAKLMAALDTVVKNFERPQENAAMLAELGRRHASYGATPEHYDIVVRLLVESMGEVLGANAAAANLNEWRTALSLIARQMIRGSGQPMNEKPPHA